MTAIAVDALLAVCIVSVWLGSAGFARLRSPLDRLHCTAFVNAVVGTALTAAAFFSDGASSRAVKILLVTLLSLLSGAATSHAAGRAVVQRGAGPEGGT